MRKQEAPPTEAEIIEENWRRGRLKFLLHSYQLALYFAIWAAINNPRCLKYVLNIARRFGKSTVLAIVAIEYSIRHPGSQIRFAAPTAKALKKITQPIFKKILRTCPADIKPEYKTQDQCWVFPNGSEIHCAGTDNGNAESLRGTASDLNLVDEAGFADDLSYVVQDILLPQTLTTGGKTILASTPPRTPAHDFADFYKAAKLEGFCSEFTVHDNTSIDEDKLKLYIKESGGEDSTTWQREYLVQFVVDSELAIIPEWSDEYVQDIPQDEFYNYYHKYGALDLGVKDKTAALFGYYDFKRASVVVEHEFEMRGSKMNTEILADAVKAKEKELWPGQKPYRRIADNNWPMMILDFTSIHDLPIIATDKEKLEEMINELRIMVQNGRILVNPRCKMLIGCLKYGVWDEKKKKFARSSVYGHFDHLAALVYWVRNLDKNTNPIPPLHGHDTYRSWTYNVKDHNLSKNASTIKNILGPKKSR